MSVTSAAKHFAAAAAKTVADLARHGAAHKLRHASTRNDVLDPSGFKSNATAIAHANATGKLSPLSLDSLPLDRHYHPGHPVTGMKHREPSGFTWNHEDEHTPDWYPQAVTTTSDANAKGKIGGKDWVAVTWHSKDNDRSRISFVDYTHPNEPSKAKYRNVELVMQDPKRPGGDHFVPVPCHVGGVSWVGHYLYVADTRGGLRVFDVSKLQKVTDKSAVAKGTLPVVLPQVGFYRVPKELRKAGKGPVFSGLSLDRKHGALVSQEYRKDQKGGHIIRWPIDLKTGQLKAHEGQVHATEAFSVPLKRVAGVLARGDGFDLATMGDPGGLWRASEGHAVKKKDTLAKGIQQFSWDSQRKQIWTLDEHPGHRAVWHFKPE